MLPSYLTSFQRILHSNLRCNTMFLSVLYYDLMSKSWNELLRHAIKNWEACHSLILLGVTSFVDRDVIVMILWLVSDTEEHRPDEEGWRVIGWVAETGSEKSKPDHWGGTSEENWTKQHKDVQRPAWGRPSTLNCYCHLRVTEWSKKVFYTLCFRVSSKLKESK